MTRRKRGYKTSPTIHVPKSTVAKHVQAAAAAAREVQSLKTDLTHNRAALVDAVKLIDELLAGTKGSWSREDTIRVERIRALSIL